MNAGHGTPASDAVPEKVNWSLIDMAKRVQKYNLHGGGKVFGQIMWLDTYSGIRVTLYVQKTGTK